MSDLKLIPFDSKLEPFVDDQPIGQLDMSKYPDNDYSKIIKDASDEFGVPYNLMYKMAETESKFNPKALGPKTKAGVAKGLYQYTDEHAKEQGVIQFDPKSSARGAAREYKENYSRYIAAGYDEETSQKMAVAAHNAGAGAVRKHKGVPPYSETEIYVSKVFETFLGNKQKAVMKGKPSVMPEVASGGSQSLGNALHSIDVGSPIIEPKKTSSGLVPFDSEPTEEDMPTPIITDPAIEKIPEPVDRKGITDEFYSKIFGADTKTEPRDYNEIAEKTKDVAGGVLKGLETIAGHPMEVTRGLFDIPASIPGFLTGMVDASVGVAKEIAGTLVLGGELNLLDVYDRASEKMQKGMELFEPAKDYLLDPVLGEKTEESEYAIRVAMAPIEGFSMVAREAASNPAWKDHPNVRGALMFGGDIAGLVAMGMLAHGRSGKAKFAKDIEEVVKVADDIGKKEKLIDQGPNEVYKQAAKKMLEMEKVQAELKAADIMDGISKDAVIREEMLMQAERIAMEKMRPVQGRASDRFVSKKGNEYRLIDDTWVDESGNKVTNNFKLKAIERGLEKRVEQEFLDKTVEGSKGLENGEPIVETKPNRSKIKRTDGEDLAIEVNKGLPDTELKYDGEYDRSALGKEPLYQFTPQAGKFEGRTLSVEEMSIKAVRDKLDGMEAEAKDAVDVAKEEIEFSAKETAKLEAKLAENKAKIDKANTDKGKAQDKAEDPNITRKEDTKLRKKDSELDTKINQLKVDREDIIEQIEAHKPEPITEVDTSTGTKTPGLEGKESPFYQDPVKSETMAKAYEGKEKAIGESPELFTQKVINDVNRWFNRQGEVDIAGARNGLSELAARADELATSDSFVKQGDFLRWKKTVEEAATWARRLDRFEIVELTQDQKVAKILDTLRNSTKDGEPSGITLTSGVDPMVGIKAMVDGAKEVAKYVRDARGMKSFKPFQAARMIKESTIRNVVDSSGNIRKDMIDKLGLAGYEIVQKMVLSKGASSISANLLKQMNKEVYSGLSRHEKGILDTLILAQRMSDIAKYKSEKKFNYPKGLEPAKVVAYGELFGKIEKLSDAKANDLLVRAEAYFEWMKKPLKDMLDTGLIKDVEYELLSKHNYRKIKLVEIFDKKRPSLKKKNRSVFDSGVESLKHGRDTDIFEPSSEIMALEVYNRAYGRIMNNEANKALYDVAKSDPTNPFVRIKTGPKDRIPSGWQKSQVYIDGKKETMHFSPNMSKEWITSNPEISYKAAQLLRYSMWSPVLRTFATGIEWGFALANLPKDVMHTWWAARTWKDGKWESVYSPTAPVFGTQMGLDLTRTFSDAVTRKGRYAEYIKEGGGMEFLVHQGRIWQKGKHLEGPMDAMYDFMGYLGETSEIMTRLAIRDRVIRNRGKERGLTMEEARKNKDITREATFAARDYLDFGQGGGLSKAADHALPYLNAAIQGTRGLFRSFQPGSGTALSSTYKLAQFAALTSGITIAALRMNPLTMENLKGNVAAENNLTIPMGDQFSFEDEKGQTRYIFWKVPLDPGQKFFKTFFEAATNKWLGNEIDVDTVVDSLKEYMPVNVTTLPPVISGSLGYVTNKDYWLNEDIWHSQTGAYGYQLPKAITGKEYGGSEEEYTPGRTPQAYIDVGKATGLSPERTKYAVEELVTSNSMWVQMMLGGYEKMFGDMPKSNKEQTMAQILSKLPVTRRFIGITNPYSKHAKKIDKSEEAVVIKREVQNKNLDSLAEGYLYEKNVKYKEVMDYMAGFKDKDTFDRLNERFKFQLKTEGLPERSFWMRLQGVPLEARAKVFVDRLNAASPEQQAQIWTEYGIVSKAGGIVGKPFREEVRELMGQK